MKNHNSEKFFSSFDFNHFKKWMSQHQESQESEILEGLEVESKVSFKKLLSKILETDKDNTIEVAKCFRKHGGKIIESNGQNFLIETKQGCFLIEKTYVQKKDY